MIKNILAIVLALEIGFYLVIGFSKSALFPDSIANSGAIEAQGGAAVKAPVSVTRDGVAKKPALLGICDQPLVQSGVEKRNSRHDAEIRASAEFRRVRYLDALENIDLVYGFYYQQMGLSLTQRVALRQLLYDREHISDDIAKVGRESNNEGIVNGLSGRSYKELVDTLGTENLRQIKAIVGEQGLEQLLSYDKNINKIAPVATICQVMASRFEVAPLKDIQAVANAITHDTGARVPGSYSLLVDCGRVDTDLGVVGINAHRVVALVGGYEVNDEGFVSSSYSIGSVVTDYTRTGGDSPLVAAIASVVAKQKAERDLAKLNQTISEEGHK